jgi:hypothetical protein
MRGLDDLVARYKSGEVIVYNQLVIAYNQLHTMTNAIRFDVESGLCKIGRGGKPWSPKRQTHCDTIELWGWAIKLKLDMGLDESGMRRTHLLWALHYLKQYPDRTCMRKSISFPGAKLPDGKTISKWVWIFIEALRELEEIVIRWESRCRKTAVRTYGY